MKHVISNQKGGARFRGLALLALSLKLETVASILLMRLASIFPLYFVHVWRISLGDVWCGGGREIVLWCFLDLTDEIR